MAWDSVSLLRKHKTKIVSQVMAGMSNISPDIPSVKCSRDLNYILTAIVDCLESNNQKSLMFDSYAPASAPDGMYSDKEIPYSQPTED